MNRFLTKRPDLHDDGLRQFNGGAVFGVDGGAAKVGGGIEHVGAREVEQVAVAHLGVLIEQRHNVALVGGVHSGGIL